MDVPNRREVVDLKRDALGLEGLQVPEDWLLLLDWEGASSAGIEDVAAGDYDYTRYSISASSDRSARLSGSASLEAGDYFDGELTTVSLSARFAPTPRLEVSADIDINRIRSLGIEAQNETTEVFGLELKAALNPRLQFSTYYQENSVGDASAWNTRLAWEFRPLSFLYIVYNRNDSDRQASSGDQLIAKVTYLFDM